jgi:hypothetical protein
MIIRMIMSAESRAESCVMNHADDEGDASASPPCGVSGAANRPSRDALLCGCGEPTCAISRSTVRAAGDVSRETSAAAAHTRQFKPYNVFENCIIL